MRLGVPTSADVLAVLAVPTAESVEGAAAAVVEAGATATVAVDLGPGSLGGLSLEPSSGFNLIMRSLIVSGQCRVSY
jgi:hypothetical protein